MQPHTPSGKSVSMTSPLARLINSLSLLSCLCLLTGAAVAAETDPDGERFDSSPDPVADVRHALDRARENDKQALVVLGANWCHDSRALAARLYKSPLADVIEEDYELVFVDVGFLDKGRDVLAEFDVPQFYATPTVLIVDPASGQVVNNGSRHVWGNAYNIDMESSVRYFEAHATTKLYADPAMESAELKELFAKIDRFEQQQAERVAAGYAVVGPLLKDYKAGKSADKFRSSWDELRDFRTAIPDDIQALRDEAKRRVAEGEQDIELEFPDYPPLSWEAG